MSARQKIQRALNAVADAISALKRARSRVDEGRADIDKALRELDDAKQICAGSLGRYPTSDLWAAIGASLVRPTRDDTAGKKLTCKDVWRGGGARCERLRCGRAPEFDQYRADEIPIRGRCRLRETGSRAKAARCTDYCSGAGCSIAAVRAATGNRGLRGAVAMEC